MNEFDAGPYWIYLVFGIGAVGLWVIGHRKWYGWLIMIPTRLATVITAVILHLDWVALGAFTYLLVDLHNMRKWHKREQFEDQAAKRFIGMVSGRFADGKKEAIKELLQLQRDIDELTGAGGLGRRNKQEHLLDEYLRRSSEEAEDLKGKRQTT